MNRKLLWLIAILVLVATSIAAYYLLTQKPSGQALPDLLARIPADSAFVIYLDAASFRSSPFLKQIVDVFGPVKQDQEYVNFVRDTGFDYSRDLDRAVLFVVPSSLEKTKAGADKWTTLTLAEGRFDREKIIQHFQRNGGNSIQAEGTEIFSIGTDEPLSLIFVSPTRIAISQEKGALIRWLRDKKSPPSAQTVADFSERLMRFSGAPLIVVGRAGKLTSNSKTKNPVEEVLRGLVQNIRWYALSARPEADRLRVALEGECESTLQAIQLGVLLEGAKMLLEAALKDPAARREMKGEEVALVEHIVRNGSIQRDSNRVQLRVEFTSAQIATLAASGDAASDR
jgi:hypothetical protein